MTKTILPTDHLRFDDVLHCDINFGDKTGLHRIKYVFLFVDRATRMRYIHQLKKLSSEEIKSTYDNLCTEIGRVLGRIMTDFDTRIISEQLFTHM